MNKEISKLLGARMIAINHNTIYFDNGMNLIIKQDGTYVTKSPNNFDKSRCEYNLHTDSQVSTEDIVGDIIKLLVDKIDDTRISIESEMRSMSSDLCNCVRNESSNIKSSISTAQYCIENRLYRCG